MNFRWPAYFVKERAMNEKAMNNFSAMGEEEKHQVIEAARNVRSKREMQNLVNDIANLDAMV